MISLTAKGTKQVRWTSSEDAVLLENRQCMTAKELVDLLPGRSWESVRSRIKTLGIIKVSEVEVECSFCKNLTVKKYFEFARNDNNFCGNECRINYFVGDKNPYWNGGESHHQGYKMIRCISEEGSLYKREHRLIVEDLIGRPLKEDEVVHHINGVRDDNRVENLKIMTRSAHIKLHWEQGDFKR